MNVHTQVSAHEPHDASHGSYQSYIMGFVLSLLLTGLSFGAVMSGLVPHSMILSAIVIFAVAQLLVQLVFFLHLGASPEQRDNTVIFVLTALLIATIVSGSLWVMHNADENMMPMQMSPERAMSKD
jgi:cytochrome o ubiquinol oxidase operon protein cyoD